MTKHQGILLMSQAAKIYNKIGLLLMRIRDNVDDPIWRKNQTWFRPGRSRSQQIHILGKIVEAILVAISSRSSSLSLTLRRCLIQSANVPCYHFSVIIIFRKLYSKCYRRTLQQLQECVHGWMVTSPVHLTSLLRFCGGCSCTFPPYHAHRSIDYLMNSRWWTR